MKILALDIASLTGWAHSLGSSGVWLLKPKKDESGGIRLIRFANKLKWLKKALGIDIIAYEAARHGGRATRGLVTHSELQGVVKALSEELEYEYKGYSPTAIKKFATGNGKASKEDMIKAACKFSGRNITDDNEADAICLLEMAKMQFQ